MRETVLRPDKELINELCGKYGDGVRDAVTDAVSAKNEDFLKIHKSVYKVKDYKKYHRHLIQLRPDVAMMIHLFHRDNDDSWESVWLDDNDEYSVADYECIKDSAHQMILQLEGHWCDLFIESLRDECNELLKEKRNSIEKLDSEIKAKE